MKRFFAMLLAVATLLSFAACSAGTLGEPQPTEPAKVMEDDRVKVDGFFVDMSHTESDGSPKKMVYLFLTFKASESNFKVDAKYTKMTIGSNTYDSDFYKESCWYMPNYYYSSYIEDIYVGNTCKVALTFKIPEGDLVAGKDVTLSDTDMPVAGLRFTTDDLVTCNSIEEIGQIVDPQGCAEIVEKMQPADDATVKKVRKAINGYYFTFYVTVGTSPMKYELEFSSKNKFELRTPLLNNSGTYEVYNGYVVLNYKTSDNPLLIEYAFENGEIALYCSDAFDIYE